MISEGKAEGVEKRGRGAKERETNKSGPSSAFSLREVKPETVSTCIFPPGMVLRALKVDGIDMEENRRRARGGREWLGC